MKIYDSLSQKKHSLNEKKITMYNCGPTVYNDIHIGNSRPIITFDVLWRFLEYLGNTVIYVHNITDVDDKIIFKAKEVKKTENELSDFYYHEYLDILKKINIKKMKIMPRVTKHIDDIIEYIQKLINLKKAYVSNGDVYFNIDTVSDSYGILSKQNLSNLLKGAKNEENVNKKNPLDFVLWKKTNIGINWKSPWSTGRPGWHTECSLFINKYIGNQVTIHGGGVDLKFPHHENENAQNIALTGMGIAKYWMHIGHINMNSEKMSKSLGNIILVKDFLMEYKYEVLRWFFYQTQYENPINYSKDKIAQSINDLVKIFSQLDKAFISFELNQKKNIFNYEISTEFIDAISDDINFPNAVAVIWTQIKKIGESIKNNDFQILNKNINYVISELAILGIEYKFVLTNQMKKNIKIWRDSINTKQYNISDKYRNLIDCEIKERNTFLK